MADEQPPPLTPRDCDLRGFQYMELDVQRLRDSKFSATPNAEAFRAGVLLWCASWHQVPAASLPDDDVELADLAGYGKMPFSVKHWRKVRVEALNGFVKCADGRLYHTVIAEKANAAFASRLQYLYEKLCDRVRKENKKRAAEDRKAIVVPPFDVWNSTGRPADIPPPPDDFPPENALRGNGEGKGKGKGELPTPPVPPAPPAPPPPAPAAPPPARALRKCPESFEVTADMAQWAATTLPQLPVDVLRRETEKFRDHTFTNAKTDWAGTWRNWMRRVVEVNAPNGGGRERPLSRAEAVVAQHLPAIASRQAPPTTRSFVEVLNGDTRVIDNETAALPAVRGR